MSIRLAILLSGSLLVSAAGGAIAGWPVLLAAGSDRAPVDSAPTPELNRSRHAVLASLDSSREEVRRRLAELELLAELMADASPRRDRLLPEATMAGGAGR
ncbi:hypothetical protein [Thalassobaculum sp.]|uniref:hypothetical protein n=1 Tax=Thalassobaculum sp. TaxID=2022740 RepID=UPI0032EB916F